MDNYSKVEELLKNYKMMKIHIENIEEEIKFVKGDIGLQGISYDGISTSPTNEIKSSVENTVLSIQEEVYFLERNIERLVADIEKIDRALEGLEDIERTVVIEKYVNAKQWWQVASKVCYSESYSRAIRSRAIKKLVKGIYG
ncbi:MAG TPA: hypothetical protein VFC79_00945 [Tissierellaceae bacterium]|nr:hypothetical protein [Tissierellaceae bacterium]